MKNIILDSHVFKEIKTQKTGTLIIIGVFLFLSISGFVYLIEESLRDLFVYLRVIHEANFWLREIIVLIFTISVLLFFAKNQKTIKLLKEQNLNGLLMTLVLVFSVSQAFQFFYSFYQFEIWPQELTEELGKYYEWRNRAYYHSIAQAGLEYFRYAIFILILNRMK